MSQLLSRPNSMTGLSRLKVMTWPSPPVNSNEASNAAGEVTGEGIGALGLVGVAGRRRDRLMTNMINTNKISAPPMAMIGKLFELLIKVSVGVGGTVTGGIGVALGDAVSTGVAV